LEGYLERKPEGYPEKPEKLEKLEKQKPGEHSEWGSPDNVLYCLEPHSVCHRVIGTLLKDPNRYSRLYEEFPAKKYVNIVL
jgi:hypothetical protein